MRVFVCANIRTPKAIAVFDGKLTSRDCRPEGPVDLKSIKPGMVVRPAAGNGRPDMTKAHEIEAVSGNVIKLKASREEATPEAAPSAPAG